MPRSSRMSPWRSSASWLLAAPAMTSTLRRFSVSSLIVAPSAQGCVDVALFIIDGAGLDSLGPELVHHALRLVTVNVGHHDLRALAVEMAAEVVCDLAGALHQHRLARQVVRIPVSLGGGLHAHVDAVGRDRRRIAGESHEPRHVVGLQPDELHVHGAGTDVFRGDVAAVERLDEPAMGTDCLLY